ncbi:glycosyltransferase [Cupriavidus basilensis]|uniref:Glycosyltransferase n=1 Tax=Cupriavidus basilensis TaxID=68895 RepID=A0A643G547_9BURK|nr:glycosyltransferase [Cupriavidus basilensis]QOT75615.1 glycosyltransferase [Cupriavidus basilensis]
MSDFRLRAPSRILLVTTGLRMGGAEQQVAALAREFIARGRQVALVSLTPDCEVPISDAVERLMLDMHKTPLSMAQALLTTRRFLRRWQPDIIHAHMFHANLFARLLTRIAPTPPLICAAHSYSEGGSQRMLAYRLTDRWCTLTTHVSEGSRAHMIETGAVRADRIVVVHNGIDTEQFQPDPHLRDLARAQLGVDAGTRLVLNIGRLVPEKAQSVLIDAYHRMERSRPTTLLIAGDGPERPALEAQIAKLKLAQSVRLLGTRNDIPALLNAADLFVLSSRVEGMPLVVGEALACGRPVVATAAPGVAELLGDAGNIVPIDDVDALARVMQGALSASPGTREDESTRRQRIASGYSLSAAAERWLALYQQLFSAASANQVHSDPCGDA